MFNIPTTCSAKDIDEKERETLEISALDSKYATIRGGGDSICSLILVVSDDGHFTGVELEGMYRSSCDNPPGKQDLDISEELASWDELSDEALDSFESTQD